MNSISYTIFGIIFSLLLIIVYFSKKRVNYIENKSLSRKVCKFFKLDNRCFLPAFGVERSKAEKEGKNGGQIRTRISQYEHKCFFQLS